MDAPAMPVAEAVAGSLEAAGLPDIRERVASRASADVLSSSLRRAGFPSVRTEVADWTIDVPDFGTVWAHCTTAGPLDDFHAGLGGADRERARQIVGGQAGTPNGSGRRIWFRHRSMYGER